MDCDFTPREFQVELLQKAIKKNIIVCSGTGTGKTFISVLLIKEFQHQLMKPYQDGGMRTIFITKTVPLAAQQAEVLTSQLCLKVGKYSGDMGVDFWSKEEWEKEFVNNQLLVMTSQILVNILSTPFLNPKQINLLIIDECHHAVGGDPVTQVMKRLRDFNISPRILGLTASVLNGKCKLERVEKRIRELEVTLNAVIETPSAKASAAAFATDPKEKMVEVSSKPTAYSALLEDIVNDLLMILKQMPTEKTEESFKIDGENWFLTDMYGSSMKLSHVVQDLLYVVQALGIWCAHEVIDMLLSELRRIEQNDLGVSTTNLRKVRDTLQSVKTRCDDTINTYLCRMNECMVVLTSNKVQRLVEVLKMSNFKYSNGKLKGIVFVQRRVAAWMLSYYLNKLATLDPDYAFLKTQPIMGHGSEPSHYKYASMKNREQQKKIKEFRVGKCNLLIATRVVEEGMDIPTCNLIVRFDAPKDFTSYIQSKGRARSADSLYVLLVDAIEKPQVLTDIRLYDKIEKTLYKICHDRLPPTEEETRKHLSSWILPSYYSGPLDGPYVSSVDAIQRVNWYCQLLPRDQLTILSPLVLWKSKLMPIQNIITLGDLDPFQDVCDTYIDEAYLANDEFNYEYDFQPKQSIYRNHVECFKCGIILPLNSPVREASVGQYMPSKKLAKQSVALIVVEKLHKAGELDHNLLPVQKDTTEFLKMFIDFEEEQVAKGFPIPGSKHRNQKYTKKIAAVLKDCGPATDFYVYKICILSKPIHQSSAKEQGTNDQMHSENACFGIVTSKKLLENVEPFPLYLADANIWIKIHLIKCSQNRLSGSQLIVLKNFQTLLFERLLKITSGMFTSLEDGSHYMIAPIKTDKTGFALDWELMENLHFFNFSEELPIEIQRQQFVFREDHFRDAVVMPLYDEGNEFRFYTVNKIKHNASPLTQFPDKIRNFKEYYRSQHNIEIQCLNQPLLESQPVQRCINLLPLKGVHEQKFNDKKKHSELLVPELVSVLPISGFLLKQAAMLPSILHRFNSLCLADELAIAVTCEYENMENKFPYAQWSTVERTCQLEAVSLYEKDNKRIDTETSWNWQNVMENGEVEDELCARDHPPASILLKALTLRSANDIMNLERLETLGDSFLKYATSIYLFCEYSQLDEGRLTMARSKIISNSHLYHLGKQKNIPKFICQDTFSPYFNWLPPHVGIDKIKEDILVQAKIPFNLWQHVSDGVDLRSLTTKQIMEIINDRTTELGKRVILETTDNVVNCYTCQMINDKSIADTIEALTGAHLLFEGPDSALQFLRWMKVNIFPMSKEGNEITKLNIPRTACFDRWKKVPFELTAGLDKFQEKIGYTFKNVSFLVQAFTHPSYIRHLITDCYQRLEFLGDAILDYLVTWQIYQDNHNFDPGQITDLRSALVNNETFARLAVEYKFDAHLKELSPKLFDSIRKFKCMLEDEKHGEMNMNLVGEAETLNEEEIDVPKALGDIFESVAGAIYIDSGLCLDSVWDVYEKMLMPLILKYAENIPVNPLREFNELFPGAIFRKTEIEKEEGIFIYKAVVEVAGMMFEGVGKNSKLAKLHAAKNALRYWKLSQET